MPFHGPSHSKAASTHVPATATGIYQAAQALGSIGAPAGNLRVATLGTTSAGTDALFSSGGTESSLSGGGISSPPTISRSSEPAMSNSGSTPASAGPGGAAHFLHGQAPRRAETFGRQSEELHMQSSSFISSQQGSQQHSPRSQHHSGLQALHDPPGNSSSLINPHQAASQMSAYTNHPPGSNLPGALQTGASGRPAPQATNTAPAGVLTIPQIQTQLQQYAPSSRPSNISHTHSYSRSSPGGFESQKYVPYPGTPDTPKYTPSTSQKYTPIQVQQHAISNSPLGLADIRPRTDSGLTDGPTSANSYSYDDELYNPSNCNYVAPWAIYAFDWCKWPVHQGSGGGAGRLAVGSYLEDGHNYIQILDTQIAPPSGSELASPGVVSYGLEFARLAEASHTYPVTRILWEPPSSQKQSTDLLATSGDHLRLWSLPPAAASASFNSITRSSSNRDPAPYKLTPLALLSNSKSPEHTAPLTSLDWNTLSPSLIITSSIDTTCTIWDIPTLTAKTQLIAHDKEVFDVRFCANSVDVFVSCGADGSVRMFDLRSLEHSTIIYEPTDKTDKGSSSGNMSPTTAQQTMSYAPPLLRLSASPHDAHLLATFAQDSNIVRILDVRQPGQALLELRGHASSVNCIEWSPTRRGMLASGADDSLVMIWDLLNQTSTPTTLSSSNGVQPAQPGNVGDIGRSPWASWRCEFEVNNLSWAPPSALNAQGGDWIGVSGGKSVWGVRL